MVDLRPVVRWSVFKWWSENQTAKSLFMVQNVWYLKGSPSHLNTGHPYCPVFKYTLIFGLSLFSQSKENYGVGTSDKAIVV